MDTLKEIGSKKKIDPDLKVQLDVFNEQKESDEAHVSSIPLKSQNTFPPLDETTP